MTIKELSRLYRLNRKIEQLKGQQAQLEYSLSTGASVPGLPHVDINDEAQRYSIERVKADIDANVKQSIVEYDHLNRYISEIADPLISQIVALRFVNRLSWRDIAQHIGGDNTADSVRMIVQRFLREN